MQDDNWELINGPAAHDIEFLNQSNQVNIIESCLKLYLTLLGIGENGCPRAPTPKILLELHRAGTLFLLNEPGEYRREYDVQVFAPDGTVVHDPPKWREVAGHMDNFYAALDDVWVASSPIDVAAFVLWRVNWVHPFRNGNGRSARALSYLCLCLKYGFLLPGERTILDLIMTKRREYEAALKAADDTLSATGNADLTAMRALLVNLLVDQLESIPEP